MKPSQFKIDRTRVQEIVSQAGNFVLARPLIFFAICMGVSLVYLLFIWWQYVIRLDFSREAEREGILLKEEELTRANEGIKQRKNRFDDAFKQEYKDLFQ